MKEQIKVSLKLLEAFNEQTVEKYLQRTKEKLFVKAIKSAQRYMKERPERIEKELHNK